VTFKAINDPEYICYQLDEDVVFLNGELDVMFSELNVPFCVDDEIVKACKKLNSGKSAGSNYWLNEFLLI